MFWESKKKMCLREKEKSEFVSVGLCLRECVCLCKRERERKEWERWQKRAAHFPKNFVNSVETFEIYLQEKKI